MGGVLRLGLEGCGRVGGSILRLLARDRDTRNPLYPGVAITAINDTKPIGVLRYQLCTQ